MYLLCTHAYVWMSVCHICGGQRKRSTALELGVAGSCETPGMLATKLKHNFILR